MSPVSNMNSRVVYFGESQRHQPSFEAEGGSTNCAAHTYQVRHVLNSILPEYMLHKEKQNAYLVVGRDLFSDWAVWPTLPLHAAAQV